jgi:segregation and condensation protein B
MEHDSLRALLEAILLTSKAPVTVAAIVEALGEEGVDAEAVRGGIDQLADRMDQEDRGVRLEAVAGGWRVVVPAQFDPYLRTFHGIATRQRLSQAALEVLAIVSHRQPVTLPEINFVRGTNSAAVVRTLLDRKMIRLAGRKKVVGKPFLYRTTKEFLVHFGLDAISELPDPEELVGKQEVESDSRALTEGE